MAAADALQAHGRGARLTGRVRPAASPLGRSAAPAIGRAGGRTVTTAPSTAGRARSPDAAHSGLELGTPARAVVDEHRRAGARGAGQVEGLLRGEVAALLVVERGRGQGRLDEQQVDVGEGRLDRGRRTGVPGVAEPGAVGRLDDHAPGRDVVPAAHEAGSSAGRWCSGSSGSYSRATNAASKKPSRSETARDRASSRSRPPGGRWIGQGIGGGDAPRIEVAQADDVQVVVGVHVADDHPGQGVRVEDLLEVADDALAQVEEDGGRAPLDQVAGRRRRRVGRRGAAAEHGETEPLAQDVVHGRHARAATSCAVGILPTRGLSHSRHLSSPPGP